jgi:hypothetical protein
LNLIPASPAKLLCGQILEKLYWSLLYRKIIQPKIYESVFFALRKELEKEGYSGHEIETLIANYSWFLSEYSC